MQNIFLKCTAVKNFSFKNRRWRTAAVLKIENSRYVITMQNGSRKRLSAFLKLIFLMECALERLVLRHHANFLEIGHNVAEIS